MRDQLETLASQLKINNHVEFLGALDQDEIMKLYDNFHIFILTSITDRDGNQEGIPVVLMEAQAKGLPVISTYHTGIPEAVLDNKSGFLVPEQDIGLLEKRIEYLIEHQELWLPMGRKGRLHIEKNFNSSFLNKKLAEIFLEISKETNLSNNN